MSILQKKTHFLFYIFFHKINNFRLEVLKDSDLIIHH